MSITIKGKEEREERGRVMLHLRICGCEEWHRASRRGSVCRKDVYP